MSPILLRPIREQIEHDRVIRQLQLRWRRRYEVAINPGKQEETSVRASGRPVYPDVILTNVVGVRRLHGIVEVETVESVNHLEAMAEWGPYSKVRGAFYLYVPAGMADVAGRLCQGGAINVTEIWTYYAIGDQVRFSMSYRSPRATRAAKALAKAKSVKKTKVSKGAGRAKATKRPRAGTAKPNPKTARRTTSARPTKRRTPTKKIPATSKAKKKR